MAWGDVFSLAEVKAFQLADFAQRCRVDRHLLKREARRMAKRAIEHAPMQAQAADYIDKAERAFAGQLSDFVLRQAERLIQLADAAAKVKDGFP